MKICYSDDKIDHELSAKFAHSLFLAGPTPRSDDVQSWRPDALKILKELNYKGLVWVPEYKEKPDDFDYLHQVNWEKWGLTSCVKIIFWVPRKIPEMSALFP